MTGPEHYREAERLAAIAVSDHYTDETKVQAARVAQVHATLALAAATALSAPDRAVSFTSAREDWETWHAAAGTAPADAEYAPQEGDEVVAEDGTRWRVIGLPMPGERRIVLLPAHARVGDHIMPRRVSAVINAHGPLTLAHRGQPADGGQ